MRKNNTFSDTSDSEFKLDFTECLSYLLCIQIYV